MSDTDRHPPRSHNDGRPGMRRKMRPYGEVTGHSPVRQEPRHYPESAVGEQRQHDSLADHLREWRQPRKAERQRAKTAILDQLEGRG